jgi:hypothetical protein
MIKKLLFWGVFLSLFNCQSNQEKLKGHWHTIREGDVYHTLDITDSLSILDKYNINGSYSSPLFNDDGKIFFPYTYHGHITEYDFKGDTLYLDSYPFLKIENTWEDIKSDFFSYLNTSISLTINNNSIPLDSIKPIGVVHCGFRKDYWLKKDNNFKKKDIVIQVKDVWISFDEISEYIDNTIRQNQDIDNYNFVLNFHKDLPDSLKIELTNTIKQNSKIYLYQSFINEDKKCIGLLAI